MNAKAIARQLVVRGHPKLARALTQAASKDPERRLAEIKKRLTKLFPLLQTKKGHDKHRAEFDKLRTERESLWREMGQ